jgi:SSS family solute:Na+ symporter
MIETTDWIIIAASLLISLGIGWWAAKKNANNAESYFLAGRDMPWWLLGISMVATTFAADTPPFVTQIVRESGVAANWTWWAFMFSGLLTTFMFARRWRRAGVVTDVEFYELRYGGKAGGFLRGFRALYLGLIFNVIVIAWVSLAAIKILGIMIGLSPFETILIGVGVTLLYSAIGGLRSVLLVDLFQFTLAMTGSIAATWYVLNMDQIGGLDGLFSNPAVQDKMNLFPKTDSGWIKLFIIPFALQWWSSYYPGSEQGGGGYVAQRMMAAKNEKHASKAGLLFNIAHYALRPWPWILIALASIIVFPTVESIGIAFPGFDKSKLADDAAYPAMIAQLPAGLKGLVLASLIAAYISTLSTQVNVGASYLTQDFWHRFVKPNASEKDHVLTGRIATVLVLLLGSVVALFLNNAGQIFNITLAIGAGTGLVYLLRWLWWRVNAWSEIAAMIGAAVSSYLFVPKDTLAFADPFGWAVAMGDGSYAAIVVLTTVIWLIATFITRPESEETLRNFVTRTSPPGSNWSRFEGPDHVSDGHSAGRDLFQTFLGSIIIIGALLGTGYLLYGNYPTAGILLVITMASSAALFRSFKK